MRLRAVVRHVVGCEAAVRTAKVSAGAVGHLCCAALCSARHALAVAVAGETDLRGSQQRVARVDARALECGKTARACKRRRCGCGTRSGGRRTSTSSQLSEHCIAICGVLLRRLVSRQRAVEAYTAEWAPLALATEVRALVRGARLRVLDKSLAALLTVALDGRGAAIPRPRTRSQEKTASASSTRASNCARKRWRCDASSCSLSKNRPQPQKKDILLSQWRLRFFFGQKTVESKSVSCLIHAFRPPTQRANDDPPPAPHFPFPFHCHTTVRATLHAVFISESL